MVRRDKKGNLEVTRGDYLPLRINSKNLVDNTDFTFQPGDVVRLSVMQENHCENVVLRKDVMVDVECTSVVIEVLSEETRLGELINEPVTYWYEVELNPDTEESQTIIGFTIKDGAKTLTLTPESGDYNDE